MKIEQAIFAYRERCLDSPEKNPVAFLVDYLRVKARPILGQFDRAGFVSKETYRSNVLVPLDRPGPKRRRGVHLANPGLIEPSCRMNVEKLTSVSSCVFEPFNNWIELEDLGDLVREYPKSSLSNQQEYRASLGLRRDRANQRLTRLGDALIDGLIDKSEYEERKKAILFELGDIREKLAETDSGSGAFSVLNKKLELLNLAQLGLKNENTSEKRRFLSEVTSNFEMHGKIVEFALRFPYSEIAKLNASGTCDPYRDAPRTRVMRIYELLTKATMPATLERQANDVDQSPQSPYVQPANDDAVGLEDAA